MKELLIIPDKTKQLFINEIQKCEILSERDFNPCQPFFINHNIKPESFDKIITKGVLEKTTFIREILKKIDYLLKKEGELLIYYFLTSHIDASEGGIRALSKLMNEISLCYSHRFKLIQRVNKDNYCILKLKKVEKTLTTDDSIEKWTFGIVSDGRKNDKIDNIIHQVHKLGIPEYEILICGPSFEVPDGLNVRFLDDSDLYWDIRIPISSKKNRIILNSKYENLVIIHDRIQFPDDWYEKIKKYGNYFDFLCTKVLDEKTKSRRVQDWLHYEGDLTEFNKHHGKLLKYSEWTPYIYIDGGYILGKKSKFEKVLLNENLHWGEAEDYILARSLYYTGNMINMYSDCYVTTATHRHPGVKLKVPLYERTKTWIWKNLYYLPYINFVKKREIVNSFDKYIKEQFS